MVRDSDLVMMTQAGPEILATAIENLKNGRAMHYLSPWWMALLGVTLVFLLYFVSLLIGTPPRYGDVLKLEKLAPGLPRGIVAERHYVHQEWKDFSDRQRRNLAVLLHGLRSRPHFVAYQVRDLPSPGPFIARNVFGLPLLTWTVRSEEDRLRARRWADQMIFEGFRP